MSIYRYPNGNLSLDDWNELFQFCEPYTSSVVLRDFNTHHTAWGCSRSDDLGKNLLSAVRSSSFNFLNDDSSTFLTRPGQCKSAIDLTFVSFPFPYTWDWEFVSDLMLSDHFPISVKLNCQIKRRTFLTHRIKLNKEDREQFLSALQDSLPKLRSFIDFDFISSSQKYDTFIQHLIDNIPEHRRKNFHGQYQLHRRTHFRNSSSPAPWWNELCDNSVADRRRALAAFKAVPSQVNLIKLKRQEALTITYFENGQKARLEILLSVSGL